MTISSIAIFFKSFFIFGHKVMRILLFGGDTLSFSSFNLSNIFFEAFDETVEIYDIKILTFSAIASLKISVPEIALNSSRNLE